ncbi:ATP-binding protein [Geoalkalibacter halelectricus]|uniref:DNA binding domain-containing protein n=1 Tax=Geoalkalibacter halelectricus TaxID=2847045 RepID=A0ABY5ZKZ4_9BACT|nr:ATP-binding protein [Geoalkalibacter halelectricus]MDO3376543.1 putative DNA binding domain-containing protein [Geoalkalibacter halelectricus]UWZ78490.1 putative DNA binding domain-containing protein [Geoalkalibacter halelectricus]
MTVERTTEYLIGLVHELRKLPAETEWVEFKHNRAEPEEIGEYLSALANSAAFLGKVNAYIIWGVDNATHNIVGTVFKPSTTKVGNEELESWLLRLLSPKINFRFHELVIDTHSVVLLEIGAAFRHPVQFKHQEFIRVGSYKKKLKNYPERERALWRVFDLVPFERGVAAEHVASENVLKLLDYPAYFDLLELPPPDGRAAILNALAADELIQPCDAGDWNITNLGAILFAKKLDEFPGLKRKAMRVVQYKGRGRIETLREQVGGKGYANGFEGLVGFIMALVPANEVIEQALRRSFPMFPELAVRELVANALIHQDLFVSGAGPMVEIFDDRMEITSPGEPLVDTQRFVDTPPKSRNEVLASLMRRFRICEERGSGIDKVVAQVELYQLPAPYFEVPAGFTRAVLFAHRPLTQMDKADRIRACYLHACLKWVMRDYLTNASLRERFGVEERNKATVSRYIREAVEEGAIKPYDEDASKKLMKYVPFWA